MTYSARFRWFFDSGTPFPSPICPGLGFTFLGLGGSTASSAEASSTSATDA